MIKYYLANPESWVSNSNQKQSGLLNSFDIFRLYDVSVNLYDILQNYTTITNNTEG